jgi:hypothetical protein
MSDMPKEIYVGKVRNDKLIVFEAENSGEKKYYSDDTVQPLIDALKPVAEYGKILRGQLARDDRVLLELWDNKITVGDLRNIATALEGFE